MQQAMKHKASDYFAVHGGTLRRESTGDKMWQLISKLDAILGADFGMVKRHIISMEFVSEYLKRCGAEKAILEGDFRRARKLVVDGKFTEAEMKTINEICRDLGEHAALVVRNSAFGDASGTGMLGNSFYSQNKDDVIAAYVKHVIASYYTEKAALFRKDACIAEGLAVGIEPMVADEMKDEEGRKCLAPCISGFGRTYSWYHGSPYLGAAYGLASEFVSNPKIGWIITEEHLLDMARFSRGGKAELLDFGDSHVDDMIFPLSQQKPMVFQDGMAKKIDKRMYTVAAPIDVFRKMERLEANCQGVIQHFEYACTEGGKTFEIKINQITDIIPKKMSDLSPAHGELLVSSDRVLGNGDVDSEWLVSVKTTEGWKHIREINEKYSKYVLIPEHESIVRQGTDMLAAADCFVGMRRDSTKITILKQLNYQDIHRMGALGVTSPSSMLSISNHFGGSLEATGKPVVLLNNVDYDLIAKNAKRIEDRGSYAVYQIGTSVRASEFEQKCEIRLRA